MLSRRLSRKFKQMRSAASQEQDPGLEFCVRWTEHLVALMKKHKSDKEFTDEVLNSALDYFKNSMSDQDRLDVFAILLRKSVFGK
jgi:uncharacterized protein YbgA (DUF1722 family)